MSQAVICDKCDLILPPDGYYKPIYTGNPFEGDHILDLCEKCYEKLFDWVEERDECDQTI